MNRNNGIELNEKQYEYMLDRLDLMNARSEFEALISTFSSDDPPRFRREAFEQLMGELRKNGKMTLDAIMYDENSPVYIVLLGERQWEKEQRSTD